MEVVSGDNWSCKACKALVKSSPPTNQHPVFYRPDALPVTQPTVSEDWGEKFPQVRKKNIQGLSGTLFQCFQRQI